MRKTKNAELQKVMQNGDKGENGHSTGMKDFSKSTLQGQRGLEW